MLHCEKTTFTLNKVIYFLEKLGVYVGAFVLFLLMIVICIHVIGRYMLALPLPGAVELINYLMVCVGSLGFAYCAAQNGHIRIEMIIERLPLKVQRVVKFITSFLSFGIVLLMTLKIFEHAIEIFQAGAVSGVLKIPQFPFLFILFFAYLLFAAELLKQVLQSAKLKEGAQ